MGWRIIRGGLTDRQPDCGNLVSSQNQAESSKLMRKLVPPSLIQTFFYMSFGSLPYLIYIFWAWTFRTQLDKSAAYLACLPASGKTLSLIKKCIFLKTHKSNFYSLSAEFFMSPSSERGISCFSHGVSVLENYCYYLILSLLILLKWGERCVICL